MYIIFLCLVFVVSRFIQDFGENSYSVMVTFHTLVLHHQTDKGNYQLIMIMITILHVMRMLHFTRSKLSHIGNLPLCVKIANSFNILSIQITCYLPMATHVMYADILGVLKVKWLNLMFPSITISFSEIMLILRGSHSLQGYRYIAHWPLILAPRMSMNISLCALFLFLFK